MKIYYILLFLIYWSGQAFAQDYTGKRAFLLHSYDAQYPWTKIINHTMETILQGYSIETKAFYLDTKNRASEAEKAAMAQQAREEIEDFKPDIVLTSDDDAAKYVLMPYYKNSHIPFVFCGINWDASEYGLPYENTTGMLEVELLDDIIRKVKEYAFGQKRIGSLALDGLTERKRVGWYREHLKNEHWGKSYFPKTFAEWKNDFLKLQNEVDIIIMLNTKGLKDWDVQQAKKFVLDNIKVATVSATEWMSPFSLLGITLIAKEQGKWAADTALKILGGQSPKDIPIVRNKEGKLFVNLEIAQKLGVTFKPALLKFGEIIH